MFKKALLVLFVGVLVNSCSSKPKNADEAGAGAGGAGLEDPSVSKQNMDFNPGGSDAGVGGLYTITFDYDQSNITKQGKELLSKNADWIKKNPNSVIQIEGHCDERGSVEYNFALGERRAKVTKDFLAGLGVDGSRLRIISYGKEKPLDKGDNDSAFAKNRRANFVPLPN
ncbi:MAG: peptidoglycan-associated lipoprotein Pal [Pseudomonadota bacterium]|nr:peptidoglycan-associated lipoprotein Pal [Pseudomonadota bacterium]